MSDRKLFILLIINLLIAIAVYTRHSVDAMIQEVPATCQAGSYEVGRIDGNPICKLEPTGCEYGDSIPLEDCDKFKPVEKVQEESSVPTTTETPRTTKVQEVCGK